MRSMRAYCLDVSTSIEHLTKTADAGKLNRKALIVAASALRDNLRALKEERTVAKELKGAPVLVSINSVEGLLNGLTNKLYQASEFRKDWRTTKKSLTALCSYFPSDSQSDEQAEFEQEVAQSVSVSSINDALSEAADFKEALATLRKNLDLASKTKQESNKDDLDDFTRDNADQVSADKLAEKIETIKKMERLLPIKIKGDFSVARVPIAAIFKPDTNQKQPAGPGSATHVLKNFTRFHSLRKLGIDHIPLEDYLILLNQSVLMIPQHEAIKFLEKRDEAEKDKVRTARREAKDSLESREGQIEKIKAEIDRLRHLSSVDQDRDANAARTRAISTLQSQLSALESHETPKATHVDMSFFTGESPKKRRKESITPIDHAREVLAVLNEQLPVTYDFVSESPIRNPKNPRIMLYWIMPASIVKALHGQGWKNLLRWGLPF